MTFHKLTIFKFTKFLLSALTEFYNQRSQVAFAHHPHLASITNNVYFADATLVLFGSVTYRHTQSMQVSLGMCKNTFQSICEITPYFGSKFNLNIQIYYTNIVLVTCTGNRKDSV